VLDDGAVVIETLGPHALDPLTAAPRATAVRAPVGPGRRIAPRSRGSQDLARAGGPRKLEGLADARHGETLQPVRAPDQPAELGIARRVPSARSMRVAMAHGSQTALIENLLGLMPEPVSSPS
jgi:hypothetical protein